MAPTRSRRSAQAPGLVFVRQQPQLGTGHALQQAAPLLDDDGTTLVLNGDVPLIETETLQRLVAAAGATRLALLTVELAEPRGYGRIVRAATRRRRDAIARSSRRRTRRAEQRAIREIYTGVMAAPTRALKRWLAALRNDNAAGEYYLTDVVASAVGEGVEVVGVAASGETEVLGVNSPAQLADLERRYQRARRGAADGARRSPRRSGTLRPARRAALRQRRRDRRRLHLRRNGRARRRRSRRRVLRAAGTRASPPARRSGRTPTSTARSLGASVGAGAIVGPFSRLRGGAVLGADVHVGNFVEIKNSTLGDGAKANHLAYLGDSDVGARVNYGAGSITANYDGANKHRTTIGADAHIGSNCVLVAPVAIGAGATIGGGSTINKDAPAGELTVARARQATVRGWKRPVKR